MRTLSLDEIVSWLTTVFISMAIISVFGFVVYATVESVKSNGVTDYCIINYSSPQGLPPIYELTGHRPWRPDRDIAKFTTIEEAIRQAEALQCPLMKVR